MGLLEPFGRRAAPWAVPLVALLMLAMVLIPAEFWHNPTNDAVYRDFDPNLIYASEEGEGSSNGLVDVSAESLRLTALPGSQPTVHLATSHLDFTAAMDLRVRENESGTLPFRAALWLPRETSAYLLDFGPPPENLVMARAVRRGAVVDTQHLGYYVPGGLYHLELSLDRETGIIRSRLFDMEQGRPATDVIESAGASETSPGPMEGAVTSAEVPQLFLDLPIALTVTSISSGGTANAVLENYSLTLPHRRGAAVRIDDRRATALLITLLSIGSLMCIGATTLWAKGRLRQRVASDGGLSLRAWATRPLAITPLPLLVGVGAALFAYLVLNGLLFNLGSHTFDLTNEKVWAYITTRYSLGDLYYLSRVVTPAKTWGGVPNGATDFPYGPSMAYVFAGIGWIHRLFFADPGGMDSLQLGFVIKSFNVLFGLADAVLIYLILRHLQVDQRLSLLGAALFLFNPAVWFIMSIWGQTQTISLFFLLGAIWLGEKRHPLPAWLALAAAALTRPQFLVPAFLLGLVFSRRFSLRENVHAISWTVIIVFLILGPLALSTGPTLPVDMLVRNFQSQNPGDPDIGKYYHVSLHAYNIWPMLTDFLGDRQGEARFYWPSSAHLVGPFSYAAFGNLLLLGVVLTISAGLLLRRGLASSAGGYIRLIAAGTLALLILRTGISPHHFVIALPLVILSRKSLNNLPYYSIVAILTITTLVSTYGSFGGTTRDLSAALHPDNNPVTSFFMRLYAQDQFITAAIIANTLALVWLALGVIPPLRISKALQRPLRALASFR